MADIHRIGLALVAAILACVSQASWYWPFESSTNAPPRLSELMQPASLLIDDAADLAADGKSQDAIEKYREALKILDKIEKENPERAKKPEFATLRNKRAYVSAAIDSIMMGQVRDNAKAVAVSDTTELEKKLAKEKMEEKGKRGRKEVEVDNGGKDLKGRKEVEKRGRKEVEVDNGGKVISKLRKQAIEAVRGGDYPTAKAVIGEMLKAKPNSAAALNLRAVVEIREGDLEAAEATLNQCIANNSKSYFAYYNMCELRLKQGKRTSAKNYYVTGRSLGGPINAQLEKELR